MTQQQLGMDFGSEPEVDKPLFDPNDIREDCIALISEARANSIELTWDAQTLKVKRIMFPNLVSWLPDEDERGQLCLEFETECKRIALLIAA